MAQLGGTFDAEGVTPNAPRETLPPGKYMVQIVSSEMRDTKSGNGKMLAMELEVIDGQYQGRKLFENLNLVNPNDKAVEIAQRTLSSICRAVGKMQVSDSEELHFKPMVATVVVQPPGQDKQGTFREAQNRINGYSSSGGGAAAPAYNNAPQRPQGGGQQAALAQPAKPVAPWLQRKSNDVPF